MMIRPPLLGVSHFLLGYKYGDLGTNVRVVCVYCVGFSLVKCWVLNTGVWLLFTDGFYWLILGFKYGGLV